jgi:hypothetical protein
VASRFALFGPITNSGTVNLTNATIALYNGNGTAYLGGINNQGAIDFYGASGDQIASFEQDEYLINQGTINEEAGTGTTSIAANVGVLMGTYNAALGTTIDFGGGFANDPLTVGAPPTLNGPGQYDFTSGYLLLTEDAITNLTLEYGTLELGPAFQQGGAITNLTLDGTTLVGTNQVSGTLTATNSQFSGVLTINSGGVLNESGASIAATGSLTVQGGGLLNVASRFSVFGPLTNAGTINLTNATISVYNANGPLYEGGINNQGAIYFYGAAGDQVTSVEGNEYLINQGTISQRPGTGNSSVDAAIFTDPGTVDSQGGTLTLTSVNSVNLQSSSVLNFGLNSPTDYGMIAIDVNVALSGTVSANFNNDFVPAKGDAFNVLSYPSFSGGFARTNLPAGTTGQGIYSSNMFTLEITGSGTGATNQPILTIARVSTSTVAVSWSTAAGNFNLQTATILPSESWSTITSGITTVGANYVLTTPVSGEPAFFRLQSQ